MTDNTNTPFVVRECTPADRAALEAMYVDFRPKRAAQGLPPNSKLRRRRWLDHVLQKGVNLAAEIDGAVVGHIMLIPTPEEGTVELANFLHQSVRNRGIGTTLNRIALDRARDLGYKRVWLSVEPSNRAAVRSYQKAGFRRLPGSLFAPEMEMAVSLAG
jgi:RimJ/RimL family protein N-acetyltransferase